MMMTTRSLAIVLLAFVALLASTSLKNHGVVVYAFGIQSSASSSSLSSTSTTTTRRLEGVILSARAKFQNDGGIMMELFPPIPNKNPSPKSQLPRTKPAAFEDEAGGLMMKEKTIQTSDRPGGKLLGIPPKTAEAIQTKGQKFATYTSDGGIMLQAALRKPNKVKATPKRTAERRGDGVLESSPTGAQTASGTGRLLVPSTVEKPTVVWKQREIDFLPAGSG